MSDVRYFRENGRHVFDWTWAARARFTERGRLMRFEPHAGAHPLSLELLRRLAGAYAESLAGRESLHATALRPPEGGGAVAFLGTSGEGKSTMASRLLSRGWRLLTDDVLPLRIDGERVLVTPVQPILKLAPAAAARWRGAPARREFDPNFKKWILRFRARRRPSPLRAIVLLRRGAARTARLERVFGAEAALIVQGCVYNEMIRPRRVLERQMEVAACAAERVPVYRLYYPSGFARLDAAARLLETLA